MTKNKSKKPFASIAEGVSSALTLIAAIPLFVITSVFDG